jgi:hypothetical protein
VHLISNPSLNPIILWISFALVIGPLAAGRAAAEQAAVRRVPAAPGRRVLTLPSLR